MIQKFGKPLKFDAMAVGRERDWMRTWGHIYALIYGIQYLHQSNLPFKCSILLFPYVAGTVALDGERGHTLDWVSLPLGLTHLFFLSYPTLLVSLYPFSLCHWWWISNIIRKFWQKKSFCFTGTVTLHSVNSISLNANYLYLRWRSNNMQNIWYVKHIIHSWNI